MHRESDLTQLWLKLFESELSHAGELGIWVESELSQLRKAVQGWVRVESPGLSHESESRQHEKESSTNLLRSLRESLIEETKMFSDEKQICKTNVPLAGD